MRQLLLQLLLLLPLLLLCHAAAVPAPPPPAASHTIAKPHHPAPRRHRAPFAKAFIRATEVIPSLGKFATAVAPHHPIPNSPLHHVPAKRRAPLSLAPDESYYPSDYGDYLPGEDIVPAISRVVTEAADSDDTEQADPEELEEHVEPESHAEEQDEAEPASAEPEPEAERVEVQPAPELAARVADAAGSSNAVAVSKTVRAAAPRKKDFAREPADAKEPVDAMEPVDATEPAVARPVDRKEPADAKEPAASSGGGGGHFRGIDAGVVEGTNVTHLSYMVFKIIKTYDIKSVIDMPCRTTLQWFPELLHRIDFEIVGFKYYCVDTDSHSQDDIRSLYTDAGSPEFLHIRPEEAHLLPKTDLVFSWDGPQQWGVKRTWSFFTAIREIRPKYLMITNNPGVANTNDQRGMLNLRKQPFHFSQALRVISHVHEDENPKQLLFYEMDGVRRGF